MKQILNLTKNKFNRITYKQWIKPFSILFTCSIMLWFLGPHLSIVTHTPFKNAKVRLLIIFLSSVLIISKYYLNYRRELAKKASLPSNIQKKLQLLEGQLHGAISFLNKPYVNQHTSGKNLNTLPWYFVIGGAGSGKTTLLANSNVNFILKKQLKTDDIDNITPSDSCSWWVTSESVLLDVPGSYLDSANEKASNPVWTNFLSMIKKWRPENSLNGVVVTLSLSELIQAEARDTLIKNLKIRIQELQAYFGKTLPIFFIITKCDLLPGFTEFFSESASDELSQSWGVSFPPNTPTNALVTMFAKRFGVLLKRLNKQLIWRLHQERGLAERVHVKDFPLYVERLKDILIQSLTTLTNAQPEFNLQGIYLTSAIQPKPLQKNQLQTKITTNASQQSLQILQTPSQPNRSYFIRQLLLQSIVNSYIQPNKSWHERKLVYATCACGIVFTILFSSYDVIHTKQQLIAMQDNIVVPTFNIVMPETKPQEQKVNDSITIIG